MAKITNLDQRVELIAADVEDLKGSGGGGGTSDSYTKAEADLKFQTIAGMSSYQTTAGMSSYLTTASAAETYQPIGSYLTASDISDMATQTWVGQQGFLTSSDVDEVPSVGSSDNGKVLTAVYNDGVASYSWQPASSGGTSDYTDLTNKPSINNVTLSGNKSTSDLGIDEVPSITSADGGKFLRANYYNATGTSDYSWENIPTPSVDEVPDVTSSDDGKVLTATYSGGQGSYAWATAASGGLSVETDGTNYWITVNGIRLYFASSEPTGTIPANSYGIGW